MVMLQQRAEHNWQAFIAIIKNDIFAVDHMNVF
jgi:hypothetical protein